MEKIDELIQQYCPDGVEYVKLGEVCGFITGFAFKAALFHSEGEPVCKTTNIQGNIVDFTDMQYFHLEDYDTPLDRYIISPQDVVIGMSGTIKVGINNSNTKCYLNQRVGKFIPQTKVLDNKFLYYVLLQNVDTLSDGIGGGSVKNLSNNDINNLEIPLPPLPVQEAIVNILDRFAVYAAELQAELQARQQQYNYYRDTLLSFEGRTDVEWKKLGEVGTEWYRGAGIKREEVSDEGIPCIRYGEIHTTYNIWFDECVSHTDESRQPAKKYADHGDILFAITSEDIPFVGNSVAYLGKERIMVGGDIVVMKHDQDPKYMSYVLSTSNAVMQKGKGKVKSKVVHTNVPSLQEIVVPIPSLEEQRRIADILDNFHSLINNLSQGLPAEIEARQQQYEYYRDKLLTFKKKEA